MDSSKRVCFAALVIPSPLDVECHITIGVAKDVTEPETRMMQQDLERKIRPHLPIQVDICNYRLRGNDNTIPTYDVSFPDLAVDHMLKSYYRTYYKGDPSKRQYPLLEPHVTVDTPAKLAWIEEIIRGHQKGCGIQVNDTTFQVRNEGGEAVFNNETWKCNSCSRLNPVTQKECSTPGCSQWRPLQAMPRRDGPSAPLAPSGDSIYEVPPPMNAPVYRPNNSKGRYPDWRCCGDMVFGSKANCWKCGRKRP